MRNSLVYSLIFILCLWSLVYKIDYQPMYLWDESRQANNAIEMAESNNFMYPTYEGQPDFWNTKPHLLIVVQATLFKLFEPGLFWLRLPSAIATACMLLMWFHFFWKRRQKHAAILFIIIMLSCRAINVYHVGRTGDYDALLMLFITGSLLSLYNLLFEEKSKTKIWQFAIYSTFAILTKSLAGLLWVPIYVILIVVFYRKPLHLLKKLLLPAFSVISVVAAYYIFREWVTPGYLSAVWNNEILGRYLLPNEGHNTSWFYYFKELHNHYFEGFVYFIILAFIAVFLYKNLRRELGFFFISTILFLVIISISATRIHWYMAPAIPLLATLIVLSIDGFLQSQRLMAWCAVLGLIVVAFWQNKLLWKENLSFDGVYMQYVFQQAEKKGYMPYKGIWLWENYCPVENYYAKVFKRKGIEFNYTNTFNFKAADTVYLYNFNFTDTLHKYYDCRQIQSPNKQTPVWVFAIDGQKNISEK